MRTIRPSRVRNADTARIYADIITHTHRIRFGDDGRGTVVRIAAIRCICQDEIRRRGYDVEVQGNPAACRAIFGIPDPM